MEMTIDNAIKHIKQARYDFCEYWEETRNDTTIAFDKAIETMRKYQMIEEIYKNWCYPTYFNATDAMNKLGEVLKDGNVD